VYILTLTGESLPNSGNPRGIYIYIDNFPPGGEYQLMLLEEKNMKRGREKGERKRRKRKKEKWEETE
jgi:hypothetical protein